MDQCFQPDRKISTEMERARYLAFCSKLQWPMGFVQVIVSGIPEVMIKIATAVWSPVANSLNKMLHKMKDLS